MVVRRTKTDADERTERRYSIQRSESAKKRLRPSQELDMDRLLRDDQCRNEADLAAEKRWRYEDHNEQDREAVSVTTK